MGIQVLKVKVKTNTNHIARRMKKITNCFYIYLTLVKLSQNPPQKYAKFHGAIYLINRFDSTILCCKAQNTQTTSTIRYKEKNKDNQTMCNISPRGQARTHGPYRTLVQKKKLGN